MESHLTIDLGVEHWNLVIETTNELQITRPTFN